MLNIKNHGIEILRFILSLSVFAHHAFWLFNNKHFGYAAIDYVFNLAQGGVDVFFVLSGFYVYKTIGKYTPMQFLRGRVLRIFPLYAIVTTAIAILQTLLPNLFSNLPKDILEAWYLSCLFVPFKQTDHTGLYLGPVLSVGWTLNYEMMFYLLAATLLQFRMNVNLTAWVIALSFIVLFGKSSVGTINTFLGNSIVFEFLIGAILAKYYNKISNCIIFRPLFAVSLNVIIFFIIYKSGVDPFDNNFRFFC